MRKAAAYLLLSAPWFTPVMAQVQTSNPIGKQNASSTPEERTYERFRSWVTQVPPGQRHGDPLVHYREYLLSKGTSTEEADTQIKMIRSQGARAEVERWNRILTEEKPSFNVHPNAFLIEMAKGRKPGKALDVGMGQGRNAIWLAQQGWDVTGFDPAGKAVALAQENARKLHVQFTTTVEGVETFHFGESRWDLILLSYAGGRENVEAIQRALKPGGILIMEAFHRDASKDHPIGGDVVFDTGELPKLYPQLRVVRYEEPVAKADFGQQEVRLVRYCGQKPE